MSWFEFNGVRNDELDIIVTETPFRPTWGEDIEYTAIAGRPEYLTQGAGTFPNKDIAISCVAADMSKLIRIYQLYKGIGTLRLSTSPNEIITAAAYPIVPKGVALTMAEMSISFSCYPFAYLANDLEWKFTADHIYERDGYTCISRDFSIGGTADCQPIVRFKFNKTPPGDIRIRIYTQNSDLYFTVPSDSRNDEIIVNSQLKMIYVLNDSEEKFSLNSGIYKGYEFPFFPGLSYSEGTAFAKNGYIYFRAWHQEGENWLDWTKNIDYLWVKCNARNY